LLKIISGGQTGVDRGALDAARDLDAEFGGWCPTGQLAEDGRIPEGYRLQEIPTQEYAARTAANVRDSDGTLIICKGEPSGGTRATREFCRRFGKPYLMIDCGQTAIEDGIRLARRFVRSLSSQADARDPLCVNKAQNKTRDPSRALGMTILNVAGPRASQWAGGHEIAYEIISGVLRRFSGHEGAVE
jgi:hypothetical protein